MDRHTPFEELVLVHQANLRGFIARFVINPEAVFDLAQDTFIEAFGMQNRFEDHGNYQAWLRGIAINRIRQYFRSEARRRSRERQAFELTLNRWRDARLLDEGGADNRLTMLVECINQLNSNDRELVSRRYFDGKGLQVLAREVKKSAGALAMELFRIRSSLAKCVRGKLEADIL